MAENAEKYKYVGNHIGDLDSGQTLEIGQEVELTSDDLSGPLVRSMIDDGTLIPANGPQEPAEEVNATQGAKDLAAEKGIDLAEVVGTGEDGRITKADVEEHVSEGEEG